MKIVIEVEGSNFYIVLPTELGADAARLLERAKIYQQDSYPRHENLIPSPKGLVMRYETGERFDPPAPATVEAQAEASKQREQWYREYQAREKAEKELAETKAALEALKAVTTCTVAAPEPYSEPSPYQYATRDCPANVYDTDEPL